VRQSDPVGFRASRIWHFVGTFSFGGVSCDTRLALTRARRDKETHAMGFLDKLLGREKKAVDTVEEKLGMHGHDHDHDHGDAGAATPPAPSAAPETPAAPDQGESA
jgi:hypothetical protein